MTTQGNKRPSADQTRTKIIDAATQLFSEKGFAATSISEIAKLAGINQSLIYHHYQDKQGLWQYVKQTLFSNYQDHRDDFFSQALAATTWRTFSSLLVQGRFQYYADNPAALKMLGWQLVDKDKQQLTGFNPEKLKKLTAKIETFKQQGQLDSTVNTNLILLTLLSTPVNYLLTRGFFQLDSASDTEFLALTEQMLANLSAR